MEASANLIDFHCHLDLFPDFEEMVAATEAAGIKTLTVTTTPRAFPRNLEITKKTQHVRAALGLHPQLIKERASEFTLFSDLLSQTRYVGEVGLDASPVHYGSFGQQQKIFRKILQLCAEAGGKILSIHSVRSATKVIDLLESELPAERGRAVLHWFSGSASEAVRAVAAGCYFGQWRDVEERADASRFVGKNSSGATIDRD